MNVQLSLVAFFATFFPMLAVGIALGVWARRPKRKLLQAPKPDDLRATLNGETRIKDLLEQCKRKEL